MVNLSSAALYGSGLVLGLANLFAYNSFLSSPTYLEHYFQYAAVKDTDDVSTLPAANTPKFWDNVATFVTVIMMVPMLIGQCFMLTPWLLNMNVQIRMIAGAILLLISMLLIPTCAASGGVSEGGAMTVVIIASALAGISTSLLQSSLYGFFGTLPTQFMGAFVFGGGLSGSINSVLRIIIASAMPSTFSGIKSSAVIFFSIGMVLMAVTVILVIAMRYNNIVIEHCKTYPIGSSAEDETLESEPKAIEETASKSEPSGEVVQKQVDMISSTEEVDSHDASSIAVIKKIWPMMACLCMTMFTSLVLFPGMGLKAMQSDADVDDNVAAGPKSEWEAEAIMPMVIILMFNVGDTIGRFMMNFKCLWMPKKYVPFLVLARIVVCVIPIALGMCDAKIIDSNANPIVIMLILGGTGGYLIGVTMAYGNGDEGLKTEQEHATAGNCLCFSLLAGASLGSVVSLLILTFGME